MEGNKEALSGEILLNFTNYIEEVKELLTMDLWENVFLNCSKNEVLIFWKLFKDREVNMSEIAEYIHVPLNTATGIVGRMEKNGLVERTRSKEDKRIVLITFSEKGRAQFQRLVDQLMGVGVKVLGELSPSELKLVEGLMTKVKKVLKEEKAKEEPAKKVRRIAIE
ncbi:MAG: MarR family transcriptional regulator [Lachnospiraceae bacterium]|nr:MarR family transcriptional regulator [Lachnospiraceae bacterium]MBP5264655.1 MarR family transcriptional regulator [Lachnospiraceae bacterium]MBP5733945.1 MarR family transcriptional regulator [Lachnospiraceae bacterium]